MNVLGWMSVVKMESVLTLMEVILALASLALLVMAKLVKVWNNTFIIFNYDDIKRMHLDVNECALNPCGLDSICTNSPGSYECGCNPGYSRTVLGCIGTYFHSLYHYTFNNCEIDDNECLAKTDNCSSNASCQNTAGGFSCSCKDGYTGDGYYCIGKFH